MSISTSNDQNRKAVLKRDGGLPLITVKNVVSNALKSLPGKPLELILVFAFVTTSLGELFGRDYGWKWYALLLLILAAFVVKEVVEPKPIIERKVAEKESEEETN